MSSTSAPRCNQPGCTEACMWIQHATRFSVKCQLHYRKKRSHPPLQYAHSPLTFYCDRKRHCPYQASPWNAIIVANSNNPAQNMRGAESYRRLNVCACGTAFLCPYCYTEEYYKTKKATNGESIYQFECQLCYSRKHSHKRILMPEGTMANEQLVFKIDQLQSCVDKLMHDRDVWTTERNNLILSGKAAIGSMQHEQFKLKATINQYWNYIVELRSQIPTTKQ